MKKNPFLLFLAPALAIALLAGCTQTISLGVDDYSPKVVVISKCEVDSIPLIFLTLSESAFGYITTNQDQYTNLVSWLKGAKATITEDGSNQSQELTEGLYKKDTTYRTIYLEEPPYYRMDTLIQEIVGYKGSLPLKAKTRYTLIIEHLGQKYTSTAISAEKTGIFLNEVKDETVTEPGSGGWYYKQVSVFIQGEKEETPYEITTSIEQPSFRYTYYLDTLPSGTIIQNYRIDTTYTKITNSTYLQLANDANQRTKIPVYTYSSGIVNDTLTMHIKVSRIAEDTWNYQNALFGQYTSGVFNDPFSEPILLPSNITNGLGHFNIAHPRDTTIKIIIKP